jgi:hypothetical protein
MAIPLLVLALLAAPQSAPQTRCGWLQNPTPANWWLIDRDGEWLIGAQGGYQAPVTTDRRSRRVTRIYSARPVPLRQCRADRRLPRL